MLTILGVGLPRTGTQSLCDALEILGLEAIHHEPQRLNPWTLKRDSFGVYDDVDAVVDAPACIFYRELGEQYPGLRYILTVRDEIRWWQSIRAHALSIQGGGDHAHVVYTDALHALLFGCAIPNPYLWRRAFAEWNRRVKADIPKEDLLILNVAGPEAWTRLCQFLGKPVPDVPFPWRNRLATTPEE